MYIQVEVFNSTPTQTRGFYANVVIPSFFFHFTSVFAARRRNTKNNGSTFRKRIQQVELDAQEKVS